MENLNSYNSGTVRL